MAAYAADGGKIHIKKKNRGKFTAAAKRAGMGVQEYARHVLANKDRYSSTLVKELTLLGTPLSGNMQMEDH